METQLREFEAAAEACAPVRFMGAMVVDLLVKLDVRNDWKRRERERAAATASKGAAWGAGDARIPPRVFPGLHVSPTPVPHHHIQPSLPSFYPSLSHPTSAHLTPPHPILALHATRKQCPIRGTPTCTPNKDLTQLRARFALIRTCFAPFTHAVIPDSRLIRADSRLIRG